MKTFRNPTGWKVDWGLKHWGVGWGRKMGERKRKRGLCRLLWWGEKKLANKGPVPKETGKKSVNKKKKVPGKTRGGTGL